MEIVSLIRRSDLFDALTLVREFCGNGVVGMGGVPIETGGVVVYSGNDRLCMAATDVQSVAFVEFTEIPWVHEPTILNRFDAEILLRMLSDGGQIDEPDDYIELSSSPLGVLKISLPITDCVVEFTPLNVTQDEIPRIDGMMRSFEVIGDSALARGVRIAGKLLSRLCGLGKFGHVSLSLATFGTSPALVAEASCGKLTARVALGLSVTD